MVRQSLPECLNRQRLMQPLFSAHTRPVQTAFSHHCALKSSRGYAPVPGCFPAPLPATRLRHSRAPPVRHHRFMPADRGVNHRVADSVASKPQLNAPAYWSLIGHDKRHCRPVRLICRNLSLRTGQGSAGAISTTARFSSIENATAPGRVSGFPAIARSASPVTTFSIASAASPVVSLISTDGCSGAEAIENRRQMAVGSGHRAEDM